MPTDASSIDSRFEAESSRTGLSGVLAIASLAGGLVPLALIITWPGPQEPAPGLILLGLVYGGPFVGVASGFVGVIVGGSKNGTLTAAMLLGMGLSVLELMFFATMHGLSL